MTAAYWDRRNLSYDLELPTITTTQAQAPNQKK